MTERGDGKHKTYVVVLRRLVNDRCYEEVRQSFVEHEEGAINQGSVHEASSRYDEQSP